MPDGSRTRTGCITCRIRKKKCDEQRPVCQGCRSRQLACYGYNEPAPGWYTSKASWKEVRSSDEAKNLQTLAETRYKIRRKVAFTEGVSDTAETSAQSLEDDGSLRRQLQLRPASTGSAVNILPASNAVLGGANIWQLRPDTIWWDSKMRSLAPDADASNEKTRLLMLFLDVIHPITHTFYKLDLSSDRSWMLDRLVGNKALYSSALSISACFDHSLTQPPSINDIGIYSTVRSLQSRAVRELQVDIEKFVLMESTPLADFIWTGVQLLDVVMNLETLEIFSMLQGHWEMHHRAARRILDHIETRVSSSLHDGTQSKASSLVESALTSWPADDRRRRSLEFCITNFIWLDVLAISTFGAQSYAPCAFDYLPLLQSSTIKPQHIMGCQGWIMAQIVEIARLEQQKALHAAQLHLPSTTAASLLHRSRQIAGSLRRGIAQLEREHNTHPAAPASEEDSRQISLAWAHGAQVFRQATLLDLEPSAQPDIIDQTSVTACLAQLEALPARLLMRASWPYTLAGCMATGAAAHARFRRVLDRTMQAAQPPGIAWKGRIVMEECWRLRLNTGDERVGWREAMEALGARVILT